MQIKKSRLAGEVTVSGAKNSALRLLAASILTDEPVLLKNFPSALSDIDLHVQMLKVLGKECDVRDGEITIREPSALVQSLIWTERSIRNTLLILGALTARFGRGQVPLPGGCDLGDRRFDLHVMLLEKLGARVWMEGDYLFAEAPGRLVGDDIHLPIRSTGATENAIISGVLAKGITRVWNPHVRPEILDLIRLLTQMGASIRVHGQMCIEIRGVSRLGGATHVVIPDNMEALTWAIGAAITGGFVEIHGFPFEHLEVPLVFLRESGMQFFRGEKSLIVKGGQSYPVEISTGPYPGINSDMQPLFAVFGAQATGESKIIDLRFPGRYAYVEQLARMGVQYEISGEMLVIHGGQQLTGTEVRALDLRAGAALLLAGLTAEGTTHISDAWQISRGYERIENKLRDLGANVS